MIHRPPLHDDYGSIEGVNHSWMKELFYWATPKDKEKEEFLKYNEEPEHFRLGQATHALLLQPTHFKDQFHVMDADLPGDKVVQILQWAFDQVTAPPPIDTGSEEVGPPLSDKLEDHYDVIIEATRAGNAIKEGYGGSWPDERRFKTILKDERSSRYWKSLMMSNGKTRITPDERISAIDMSNSAINHPKIGILFNAANHPEGFHVYCEHTLTAEMKVVDSDGQTRNILGKGKADILVINKSSETVYITEDIFFLPGYFYIVDVKTSSRGANPIYFVRSNRTDRQVAYYSMLAKKMYPDLEEGEAMMLYLFALGKSKPMLVQFSKKTMLYAMHGLIKDDQTGKSRYPKRNEITDSIIKKRPNGITHGMASLIMKYVELEKQGKFDCEPIAINDAFKIDLYL